jgi:phosphoenolpyruvate carboxylase
MDAPTHAVLTRHLDLAADACGLTRGRDLARQIHALCEQAGDAMDSPYHAEAAGLISLLPPAELGEILRFVTAKFHVLNQAEQVNIIRVNRERAAEATPDRPRSESLPDAARRLRQLGLDSAGIRALIRVLDIQPTLTAHPTEAKRRSVLDNLVRIAEVLQGLADPMVPDRERRSQEERLEGLLQLLLATDDVRPKRLDVVDEVKNGLFFLRSSIWSCVPKLMRELADAASNGVGEDALDVSELPPLIRYRTWIGGDRDGNPRVTHDVTSTTLRMLRGAAIELWERELLDLQRELTLSRRSVPIPRWFVDLVERDGTRFIEDPAHVEQRQHEPVRIRLMQMRGRLKHDASYDGAALVADLLAIRDAVVQAGLARAVASGRLADAIVRARVFGLHLATLDIRQHSRVHESAVAELLALAGVTSDYMSLGEAERVAVLRAELSQPRPLRPSDTLLSPETDELMKTLETVRAAVAADRRAVRSYIISMTHGISDVLEVLLLMKEAGLSRFRRDTRGTPGLRSTLHVVPLLETIDDLQRGESLVGAMLDEPLYRSHIESLIPPDAAEHAPLQEIMLGYSDSNKDGGFFMANAALDDAQRRIAGAVRSRGVLLRFFHGRGGTIGRGGGRAGRAILASPAPARTGRIRFTEQGEVISFRYALPAIAQRHIEQIVHASLLACADTREREASPELAAIVEQLSRRSIERYRSLIDDPDFWPWFVDASPISSIAGLPIASRPLMRGGGSGVSGPQASFDQLRAIPWVFSWVQMRCLAPGWFGLGTALANASGPELHLLAREYTQSAWLSTVIDNAAQELLRARMPIAKRYALAAPSHAGERIFRILRTEYEDAIRGVLRVSGRASLGERSPIITRSIGVRNPWTDVLNLIQIDLLSRRRTASDDSRAEIDTLLQQSVSGIAAAMQSTG